MRGLARAVMFALVAYWLGLFILTHLPTLPPPIVPANDKIAHFVGYGLLASLLFGVQRIRGNRNPAVIVLAIVLAYGAIDEWLQIPVGRNCELADWFADSAGAATAVVVGSGISRLFSR